MDAEILFSLAHWLMLEKCRQVGIDPSGSHCEKLPRRQGERAYRIVKDDTNRTFMQVTLRKAHGHPRHYQNE